MTAQGRGERALPGAAAPPGAAAQPARQHTRRGKRAPCARRG